MRPRNSPRDSVRHVQGTFHRAPRSGNVWHVFASRASVFSWVPHALTVLPVHLEGAAEEPLFSQPAHNLPSLAIGVLTSPRRNARAYLLCALLVCHFVERLKCTKCSEVADPFEDSVRSFTPFV
ncbi:hypothetical protein BHE74_00051729 [Ensete ventricosum]|nr:hypothetical protein GW17_00037103 [Ensete ventricosum]RWW42681.1 hypothetical protein BHE74_00051729 [Ensete ventricosum]RZS04555.1 hypothetical protein BHM03_00034909 [Ensete ventricosum]